jgi:hypothetical protein
MPPRRLAPAGLCRCCWLQLWPFRQAHMSIVFPSLPRLFLAKALGKQIRCLAAHVAESAQIAHKYHRVPHSIQRLTRVSPVGGESFINVFDREYPGQSSEFEQLNLELSER